MRWHRWSSLRRAGWALIAAGAVGLAIVLPVRALQTHGNDFNTIVGWANILAYTLAALGFALLVLDRKRPARELSQGELDTAASTLAAAVQAREGPVLVRLLGTTETSEISANVRFELIDPSEPGRTGRTGDLANVSEFFTEHANGRLVILGGPGSGKTVLALELLQQLLVKRVDPVTGDEKARDPVPVRFSLPSWDTDQPLQDWLTAQLRDHYDWSDDRWPGALVRAGRILPVLDGLDEMDPANEPATRAAQAVRGIKHYLSTIGRPHVVLTCRIDDRARIPGWIERAAEVRIKPLTPQEIESYLLEATRNVPAAWRAWQELLSRPRDQDVRRLLEQLNTPWRLTLAATFSQDRGTVAELLPLATERPPAGQDPTVEQDQRYAARVTNTLVDRFIPARTRLHDNGRYSSDQAPAWLGTISEHLRWQADHAMSGSDIVLDQWWPIAGRSRVKRWQAGFSVASVAISAVTVGIVLNGSVGATIERLRSSLANLSLVSRSDLVGGTAVILVLLSMLAMAIGAARADHVRPSRLGLQQLRTRQGKRQLTRRLIGDLAISLVLGLAVDLTLRLIDIDSDLMDALWGFLALGLVSGVMRGLEPIGAMAVTPRDPIRNDLLVWMATSIASGVAVGFTTQDAVGFVAGAVSGFVLGLTTVLVSERGGNASLRYGIAVSLFCRKQPIRLGAFLDWANRAGILRISGNAYQFRHNELRDRLQRLHPSEDPTPEGDRLVSTAGRERSS